MPRILKKHGIRNNPHFENWIDDTEPSIYERAWKGGMPSQRPDRWASFDPENLSCRAKTARRSWFHQTMAFSIVLSGTIWAWFLSASVPPEIFSCRQIAQSSAFWIWLPSFALQYLVVRWVGTRATRIKSAMWILFIKDSIFSAAIVGMIILTQWGMMNRSGQYSPLEEVLSD
jgi:hypothetical protein